MLLSRTTAATTPEWLTVVGFGALPTIGLIAGPAYAALVFGLAVIHLMLGLTRREPAPSFDRNLNLLALAFALLCWASVLWSVEPSRSQSAALQVTAILAGVLMVVAMPRPTGAGVDGLFRVLALATTAGAVVFVIDAALGYPLQQALLGRPPPIVATKYNRGVDHLVLIAWPVLGFVLIRRDRLLTLLFTPALLLILGLTRSLAAQAAAVTGLLVLLIAWHWPRLAGLLLGAVTTVFAAGLPFILRAVAEHRQALAVALKRSGLHRLEIWDFMAGHALQKPLLGWGIASASRLPVSAEELSRYVMLRDGRIYPHNQWLQLWVETGAVGVTIGLGFALLVLLRIQRLRPAHRPFAYATYAATVTVACVNFEVTTDSWWAAMAASAYLLATLDSATEQPRAVHHAVLPAERA